MEIFFLVVLLIIVLSSIRQINQYERGVLFTMGKFSRVCEAGWIVVWPIFQSMSKIDTRTKAIDVPDQEAITKDNIPVKINAVIYFKIFDAKKAILEVEHYMYAVSQLAQTTMRNCAGEYTLDQLLADRVAMAKMIKESVDKVSDEWGIDVQSVELKDIILPESLKRTIAKVAEAEREKKSVIISSEGEVVASKNMSQAAQTLAKAPGALHLRTLQSINDMSSDQSNTVVWMLPVELLKAMEGFSKDFNKKKNM